MHKACHIAVQANTLIGVGARSAVFQVTLDNAADVRKLAAYLVMPARKEFDFKQMITVGVLKPPVFELCEFGISAGSFYNIAFILLLGVACKSYGKYNDKMSENKQWHAIG